ncbi:MAG TPA: glycosyltransferase family 2 protein [Opitutaceae bacterium]|nr:glycosyltransferase family 2 protein [Opitutaceae bacterium]
MTAPRFSIIMPTFNHGRWIEQALRSILDQAPHRIEIRVMDSLSTDNTAEVLERYTGCVHWNREKDAGQADAINRGLAMASGEIIAWLNSDDGYLPHAFARVDAAFSEDPALDFAYGDALEIDEGGRILTPNPFTEEADRNRFFFSHDYICQPSLFIRRECLTKVGPLRQDLKWFLDYEWLTRFFSKGLRGKRLPYFLAANRDHPHTKTNSGGLKRWLEIMSVLSAAPPPRPPLLLRPCIRNYTLEYLIKTINAAGWGRHASAASDAREARATTLNTLNRIFMTSVKPRSVDDIMARFHRDIAPHGSTLQDLWTSGARMGAVT